MAKSVDSDSVLVLFFGFSVLLEGGIIAGMSQCASDGSRVAVSSSTLFVKLLTDDRKKV
jgi:hypothetical protein